MTINALGRVLYAALFVATSFVPIWVHAQNVYRCGNVYSQIPCDGATTVQTGDERTKTQKSHAQASLKKDIKTADNLEKSRLKQEENRAREMAQSAQKSTATPPQGPAKADQTPKSGKQAEFFTARAPGDDKKTKRSEPEKEAGANAGSGSNKK